MAADDTKPERNRSGLTGLARTLAAPALLAVLLAGVFAKEQYDNAAEFQQERLRVERALADELVELTQRLSLIAGRNSRAIVGASDGDALRAWSHGGFDKLFLVDFETGKAVSGGPLIEPPEAYAPYAPQLTAAVAEARRGVAESLRGLLVEDGERPLTRPVAAQAYKSLYISHEGAPIAVVIAPFANPRQGAGADPSYKQALIGLRGFDGGVLGRITQRAGVPVTLHDDRPHLGASEHAHFQIAGPDSILAWAPQHPGDAAADRWRMIIAMLAAVYAGFVAVRARRQLAELSAREQAATRSAGSDLLTGLPNRLMFAQLVDAELARIARAHTGFAIFYLDLDRFKEINDTFGHAAGDRMIIGLAQRVSKVLRQSDRMSRLSGDEFAILQTDVHGPRDCELLASRILKAMSEPFDLGDGEVIAGVSIGIALAPQNSRDGYELMHLADLALYRAKNEGRNRFCFFETRMGEELRLRRSIEDDLRAAIASDALTLHFQPVFETATGKVASVEALVRWPHPTQGLLYPDDFLGIAEDRGLSLPLNEWVLRQACLRARDWSDLRLAVNISPIQFRHGEFLGAVRRILDVTGFDPTRLEVEITEAVVLANAAQAETTILDLRAMGMRVTLDDFGCGYSSLLYLRRFAFDKIKIDRSLLETMEATGESAIIVRTTLDLARALGLTVTAKGVEHEEQRRLLESFGCHELQGFALAAPMPPEDVDRFCASRSRPRLALDEDAASPLMSDPKFNAAGIPRPAV
jgi:diguanylate cyclase (GGDEF)-like protein